MKKTDIKKRVAQFMLRHGMTEHSDNIITGLSGGADSVCLLFILHELKRELPEFASLNLYALHLNHMIRGAEADRDETFAREFCKSLDIPLTVEKRDIPAIANETGESLETAGRRIRYELFREKAGELGGALTATAHHQNDSAETVLFNMARGTGLAGITGIAPKKGNIIRPLLCLTRAEIEEFIKENGLDYVTDSTNSDTDYTRNFIRHNIITPIEKNINKNFIRHISNLSEIAEKYKLYVDSQADELIKVNGKPQSDGALSFVKKDIDNLPDILLETIIMKLYQNLSGEGLDLGAERIEALCEAIRTGDSTAKTIELPKSIRVKITGGRVDFYKEDETGLQTNEPAPLYFMDEKVRSELESGRTICFTYDRFEITLRLTPEFTKNSNSDYTKYFNYDKINSNVCFRKRMPGDALVIDSAGSKKKLKKEFIDRKIPERLRDSCLIMAEGSNCLWAVGVRQSADTFADKESTVLKITVKETEKNTI